MITFVKKIIMASGVLYFIKSFQWIGHPSIRKYVILTGLFSTILFFLMAWGMITFSSWFADLLSLWIPWEWKGESTLFTWIINILSFVILFGIYKYIVLAALSPLMSIISEKLEDHVGGPIKNKKGVNLITGMARGIRVNVVNLSKELFYTALMLLLSLFPGFALLTAPLIFLVQAYFAGYGVMDFYLERYAGYSMSVRIVRRERWFAMSVGGIFILIFSIPLIGMIAAPILGTIASTLYFEEKGLEV